MITPIIIAINKIHCVVNDVPLSPSLYSYASTKLPLCEYILKEDRIKFSRKMIFIFFTVIIIFLEKYYQ